jgi:hypothetical protein
MYDFNRSNAGFSSSRDAGIVLESHNPISRFLRRGITLSRIENYNALPEQGLAQ